MILATDSPSSHDYRCGVCSSAITNPALSNVEYRADFVRDSVTTVRLTHKACSRDHEWRWATGRAFVGHRGYWVADRVASLAARGGAEADWLRHFALDHPHDTWRSSFNDWFENESAAR